MAGLNRRESRTGLRCRILLILYILFADILQTALVAIRPGPGSTDLPAVPDQSVAEVASFLRRNNLPQCHLHLLGFLNAIHQADPVAEPNTMRIRNNGRLSEYVDRKSVV